MGFNIRPASKEAYNRNQIRMVRYYLYEDLNFKHCDVSVEIERLPRLVVMFHNKVKHIVTDEIKKCIHHLGFTIEFEDYD